MPFLRTNVHGASRRSIRGGGAITQACADTERNGKKETAVKPISTSLRLGFTNQCTLGVQHQQIIYRVHFLYKKKTCIWLFYNHDVIVPAKVVLNDASLLTQYEVSLSELSTVYCR